MRYRVRHMTGYYYQESASFCLNQVHLTPRECSWQRCESTKLVIEPNSTAMQAWTDYFGNAVHHFSIEAPHDELTVTAESTVSVSPRKIPAPSATIAWERARDVLASRGAMRGPAVATRREEGQGQRVNDQKAADAANGEDERFRATQFTFESPFIRMLSVAKDYALESFTPNRPLLEAVLELTQRIFQDFKYDTTATCLSTPTAELFRTRRGLCQDFAHLQITCLRTLGLAARYVSGYLLTDPPPGQPKLVGSDASHAWISIYCPEYGWIDLDPTNNQIPQIRHVTVAWGRDYGDVSPMKGVFLGGGDHRMAISVDVVPIEV